MNEEFLLIVESLEKYKDLLENKNDEISISCEEVKSWRK